MSHLGNRKKRREEKNKKKTKWKKLNLEIHVDKIKWEQMANRVGSYLPKSDQSATQTELN